MCESQVTLWLWFFDMSDIVCCFHISLVGYFVSITGAGVSVFFVNVTLHHWAQWQVQLPHFFGALHVSRSAVFFCGLHMKPRGNRLSSNQTWQLSITVIHNAFDDLIYCNYIHSGFLIAMFRITGEQILYQTGLQSLFPRHDWFWLNPVKWHRLISYCCCLYPITSPDANCILLH